MNEKDPIKQSLDKFSKNLNQETVNQLDSIRKKALATSHQPKWYQNISWPMLGPAIAAMVLVVVFLVSNQNQIIEPKTDLLFDDLDLLTHEVDAELLEDLEFIAWLENENILEGELL